ncbi:hypothetical protein R84981_000118 [Carnimonas sp. R-84981]|uniref:glutamine amidotransferase-related protein n=1 Tax=Carnimonas bestiolae TaxID=3402172 RepID=UPI003EDBFE58
MRVGLLQCDDLAAEQLERFGNYPELYGQLLRGVDDTIELETWRVHEGELPDDTLAMDAWLISGSKASVYDDSEWVSGLLGFIRLLWEERRPLLGICFGHQAIAQALGGKVERSVEGWGLGTALNHIERTTDWMEPPREDVRLVVVHQDQVTELPPVSQVLASTPHCINAIIQYDECFLGIQGHPEFSSELARELVNERQSLLSADQAPVWLASLDNPTDERLVACWIVEFIEHALVEAQSFALIRSG